MTTVSPILPATPTIDPKNVVMNAAGFAWRDFMVRLPAALIADDLKEPAIWRRVQKGSNALRRHDRVYVVSFDEKWVAEAIVADADAKGAVLAKPRLTTFPERYDNFFEDDDYRIVWTGAGFQVQRKSDGHLVTGLAPNAALAERDLRQLYAVRA